MRKTTTCVCGAVIPFRNVYDHYRLTPHYRAVRAQHGFGSHSPRVCAFLNAAEAATERGETVLCFAPARQDEARERALLSRCERAGYLEYVCPHCGQPLSFHGKVKQFRLPRSF